MMKYLLRSICIVLSMTMVFAGLGIAGAQTTGSYSVVMEEDFSAGVYKESSRWVSGTSQISRKADGDFALKVTAGNSVLIRFPKVIKTGKLTIDFDFYTSALFTGTSYFKVNMTSGSANMMVLQSYDKDKDGTVDTSRIRTGNYSDFIYPEPQKFYRLRMVLDADANTCVMYCGDTVSKSAQYDKITNASPVYLSSGINEIELTNTLKGDAYYLIDNMVVYEGEAPSVQAPQSSDIGIDNYAAYNNGGSFVSESRVVCPDNGDYEILSAIKTADGSELIDARVLEPAGSVVTHESEVSSDEGYIHELYLWENRSSLKPLTVKYSQQVLPRDVTEAKALLSELDFASHSELAGVKELYDLGRYDEALTAYKDIFFTRMKKFFDNGLVVSTVSGSAAKGKTLYEENRPSILYTDGKTHEWDLGTPGSYYWWEETQYSNLIMSFMQDLMQAYLTYGDIKYFQRWVVMWEDFQKNFAANAPTANDKKKANQILREGLGVGPITERSLGDLYHALAKDYDGVTQSIDNDAFISLIRLWQRASTDCTVIITTPNQCIGAITYVCMLYPAISDFTWGADNLERSLSRLDVYMADNYLPDGQDAEMSFNYNYGFIRNAIKIRNSLEQYGLTPDYDLGELAKTRLRSMSSLMTPQGKLPNIGKTYLSYNQNSYIKEYSGMVGGEELADIIRAHTFDDAEAVPAFNSIAFPYAGYYALRDGWDTDSTYAFFRSGRHNVGHSDYQCLQLMLSAYGERLLIAAGPTAYSKIAIDDYLTSTFAGNTVSVDGYSQVFNSRTDIEDMQSIIPSLYHDGTWVAYAEGEYDNGYGIINSADMTSQTKTVTGVTHGRKLITDFENGIAVTADTLTANDGNTHQYTLNWNLAYKFNKLDYADITDNGFATNSSVAGPGIEVRTFCDETITYDKYCGYSAPADINTGDERSYKGWYLESYGVDYKPSLHLEGTWQSNADISKAVSLILPDNGTSPVKTTYKLGGSGFAAELTNGRMVYCAANDFDKESINAKGGFFYVVKDGDTFKGIAIDAESLEIDGTTIGTGSFEFVLTAGNVTVKEITAPKAFNWVKTDEGYMPDYTGNK